MSRSLVIDLLIEDALNTDKDAKKEILENKERYIKMHLPIVFKHKVSEDYVKGIFKGKEVN